MVPNPERCFFHPSHPRPVEKFVLHPEKEWAVAGASE
jgi:hypothetical protein